MRIALGADHAGRALKDQCASHLRDLGHEVKDLGTNTDEPVDYPDFAAAVADAVVAGVVDLGVCCCGSGIGVSIAANKVHGARAALVPDVTSARLARLHNDANVACFGARTMGESVVLDALDAFVTTEFSGGRHAPRVEKIARLEEEQ